MRNILTSPLLLVLLLSRSLTKPPVDANEIDVDDDDSIRSCSKTIFDAFSSSHIPVLQAPDAKSTSSLILTIDELDSALNGIWTSARCEVTPGPLFGVRRIDFFAASSTWTPSKAAGNLATSQQKQSSQSQQRQEIEDEFQLNDNDGGDGGDNQNFLKTASSTMVFRSLYVKYIDGQCRWPLLAFSAQGQLHFESSSVSNSDYFDSSSDLRFPALPGRPTDLTLFRVQLTIINATSLLFSNKKLSQRYFPGGGASTTLKMKQTNASPATPHRRRHRSTRHHRRSNRRVVGRSCRLNTLWPNLYSVLTNRDEYSERNSPSVFELYNWASASPKHESTIEPTKSTNSAGGPSEDLASLRLACLRQQIGIVGFDVDELLLLAVEQLNRLRVLRTGQTFQGTSSTSGVSESAPDSALLPRESALSVRPTSLSPNILLHYRPGVSEFCEMCLTLATRQGILEEHEAFIRTATPVSSNSLTNLFTFIQVTKQDSQESSYIPPIQQSVLTGLNQLAVLPNIQPHIISTSSSTTLSVLLKGAWTSTRCETRPNGVYVTRRLVFGRESAAFFTATVIHFDDSRCQRPTYELEVAGDYRRLIDSSGSGVDEELSGAYKFLFNVVTARITPRNNWALGMLQEFSRTGPSACGRGSRWRLDIGQELSSTGGCQALGVVVPTEEFQLLRLEQVPLGGASFLYIGDAFSRRRRRDKDDTEDNAQVDSDDGIIDNEPRAWPTAFLEPLVTCRVIAAAAALTLTTTPPYPRRSSDLVDVQVAAAATTTTTTMSVPPQITLMSVVYRPRSTTTWSVRRVSMTTAAAVSYVDADVIVLKGPQMATEGDDDDINDGLAMIKSARANGGGGANKYVASGNSQHTTSGSSPSPSSAALIKWCISSCNKHQKQPLLLFCFCIVSFFQLILFVILLLCA